MRVVASGAVWMFASDFCMILIEAGYEVIWLDRSAVDITSAACVDISMRVVPTPNIVSTRWSI